MSEESWGRSVERERDVGRSIVGRWSAERDLLWYSCLSMAPWFLQRSLRDKQVLSGTPAGWGQCACRVASMESREICYTLRTLSHDVYNLQASIRDGCVFTCSVFKVGWVWGKGQVCVYIECGLLNILYDLRKKCPAFIYLAQWRWRQNPLIWRAAGTVWKTSVSRIKREKHFHETNKSKQWGEIFSTEHAHSF